MRPGTPPCSKVWPVGSAVAISLYKVNIYRFFDSNAPVSRPSGRDEPVSCRATRRAPLASCLALCAPRLTSRATQPACASRRLRLGPPAPCAALVRAASTSLHWVQQVDKHML
jgi:hypothetical protein